MRMVVKHGKLIIGAIFGAMVASLVGGTEVCADPLPGKVDRVHKSFNSAAKKIDTDIRMVLTECQEITCSYSLSGDLGAIAYRTQEASDGLKNFVLLYGNGSDATAMILSMGILMIVFSPDAEKDERGTAITRLAGGLTPGSEKASVILGPTKYSVSNLGGMGIWFQVEAR